MRTSSNTMVINFHNPKPITFQLTNIVIELNLINDLAINGSYQNLIYNLSNWILVIKPYLANDGPRDTRENINITSNFKY